MSSQSYRPDTGPCYAIIWPYDNCKLFDKGKIVFYKIVLYWDEHKRAKRLLFWHPSDNKWTESSRPNIMEDSCSISLISQMMMRSALHGDDSLTGELPGGVL